ncbi:hypothetical protein EI94DRAFT_1269218 [Lactarius quietus]|nr:hypothetical protein EI94DRAFT_1269218 [Lactarius quietus]
MIIFSFGIPKAILAHKGQSIALTTFELVAAMVLAAVLFWFGQYDANKFKWLLQVDLAPAIGYCAKRFIAGVLGELFRRDCALIIVSLSTLPVILYARRSGFTFHPAVGFLVHNGLSVFGLILWRLTQPVRSRAQIWGQQVVLGFVAEYGPFEPLAKRYGRLALFSMVGTVMAIVSVIALYVTPVVLFVVSNYSEIHIDGPLAKRG